MYGMLIYLGDNCSPSPQGATPSLPADLAVATLGVNSSGAVDSFAVVTVVDNSTDNLVLSQKKSIFKVLVSTF